MPREQNLQTSNLNMTQFVEDCPRCGTNKTTFDLLGSTEVGHGYVDWQLQYEAFGVCRHCKRGTIFKFELNEFEMYRAFAHAGVNGLLSHKGSISNFVKTLGYVNQKDRKSNPPPEHLPVAIDAAFKEGATCMQVQCYNAGGTMFRLCVDLATQELLPLETEPNAPKGKQRRDLGLRLQWLFDHNKLPSDLHDLAQCIKEDGNDGAHRGTLSKADVEDLIDFTIHLLERRYTIPARLAEASERRLARKNNH